MEPILRVEHLVREYGGKGSVTRAIDDVSFSVNQGAPPLTVPPPVRSGWREKR